MTTNDNEEEEDEDDVDAAAVEDEDGPVIKNVSDATVLIENEILSEISREELEKNTSVENSGTSSPPTPDSKAGLIKKENNDSYLINFYRPTAASLGIKEVVEVNKERSKMCFNARSFKVVVKAATLNPEIIIFNTVLLSMVIYRSFPEI